MTKKKMAYMVMYHVLKPSLRFNTPWKSIVSGGGRGGALQKKCDFFETHNKKRVDSDSHHNYK
jgi:hypothetical protein